MVALSAAARKTLRLFHRAWRNRDGLAHDLLQALARQRIDVGAWSSCTLLLCA
jgi:hypothetical protein